MPRTALCNMHTKCIKWGCSHAYIFKQQTQRVLLAHYEATPLLDSFPITELKNVHQRYHLAEHFKHYFTPAVALAIRKLFMLNKYRR